MDLNKFLEKDIITFLEEKEAEKEAKQESVKEEIDTLSAEKDYISLLDKALANRDLYQAKKLFDEVKNKFASADDEEEKNFYTELLESMYTSMKSFSAKEDVEKEFVKDIIGLTHEKKTTEGFESKLREEIESARNKLVKALNENDAETAVHQYEIMKARFDEYPEDDKEEKEDLFNEVMSAHNQIKKFEKIEKRETETKELEKRSLKSQLLAKTKDQITLSSKKIGVYLEEDELRNAMMEYETMKEVFDNFPRELYEEKKAIYSHLMKVYTQIHDKAEEIQKKGKRKHKMIGPIMGKSNIQYKEEMAAEIEQENEHHILSTEPKQDSSIIGEPIKKDNYHAMLELKKKLKKAIALLKERNLDESEIILLEVKQALSQFPEEKVTEKKQFEDLIDGINQRVHLMKETSELEKHV